MNKNKKMIITFGVIVVILIVTIIVGFICNWFKNKKEDEKELNNPESVIAEYFACIKSGDYNGAYELISAEGKAEVLEEELAKKYDEIYGNINISEINVTDIKTEKIDNNNSKVTYTTNINCMYGQMKFENTVSMRKQDDKKYYIQWSYDMIYPGLLPDDKIDVEETTAKRGSIIDRNGVLLAGSGYIASVGLVPGWMNEETKSQDIQTVANLLGMTVESVNKKLGASYVKSDTFVELATISKQKLSVIDGLNQIDGVKIKDVSSRVYPLGEKAAHLTGYVQKVNAEELKANPQYNENTLVGRTGLEKVYEDRLKGKDGYKVSLVNESGENKKVIIDTEKEDGENIKLTIDSNIQEMVYNQYVGDNSAEVVMNPKTGEVLALVSTPSYDPNKFVIGMTSQEWSAISDNANNPLYARFLRSYAPGSSFKPITGAIALQTGTITGADEYEASGTSWQKDNSWGSYYITTLKEYSGPANLLNALINSDNIFFAKTALKIGNDKFEEQLKNIGFESDVNFELELAHSQISNNGKFASEVQLADSGYGQGQILVNPVHVASIYSSFVNDGNMVMPYLEIKGNNVDGEKNNQETTANASVKYLKENAFSKETAEEIRNDLIQTIDNPEGTAHSAKMDGVVLAGKTGTAETKTSKDENAKEFGWFNCFIADANSKDQLLIISMVENVENKGGSTYVVGKVKNVIKQILEQEN